MIKLYHVKITKNIDFLNSLLLRKGESFKNSKNIYIYQNPNSTRWICLASTSPYTDNYKRIDVTHFRRNCFFGFMNDSVNIKEIMYIPNKKIITKLIRGGSLGWEDYLTYEELKNIS